MKPLEEIIAPFKDQLSNAEYKNINNGDLSVDVYLFQKWAHRVGKGWYGFALGTVPFVWASIIDKFLDELLLAAPDFEIHQIKLKWGGLRFYVALNIKDDIDNQKSKLINQQIRELEELLYSESLVY